VGSIDQLMGGRFTPRIHFCTKLVLNSLAKVNQNEVITFERLKISLKPLVGPLGLGQRPGKPLRLVSKTKPLGFFSSMGRCFHLKHAEAFDRPPSRGGSVEGACGQPHKQ
jgi:hypothetical protein